MKTEESYSAVIVSTGDELIVAVVVLGLSEKVMVIFIAPHWHVPSSHVPKLYGLMMAGHEVALFVGIVIHAYDLISALLACLDDVFVTEWG